MLDLSKIKQYPLKTDQYFQDVYPKTQIYLHHTAGNSNPYITADSWKSTPIKVSTCMIVGGKPGKNATFADGEIVQVHSSKHWGYHLGLKTSVFSEVKLPYLSLDKISIGVEVCNWGPITLTKKGWTTYVGSTIPESEVVEYEVPFKGFKHYHKYTDAQLSSLHDLLVYWGDKYKIPIAYKGDSIFDIDIRALKGDPGVYTHVSVRHDKSDMHPQPELKEMLRSL